MIYLISIIIIISVLCIWILYEQSFSFALFHEKLSEPNLKSQTLEGTEQGGSLFSEIKLQNSPKYMALNSENGVIYTVNESGAVTLIDTNMNKIIGEISVDHVIDNLIVDSFQNLVFIGGNISNGTIFIINGTSQDIDRKITLNGDLYDFDFNPSNKKLYAARGELGEISIIDVNNDTEGIKNLTIPNAIISSTSVNPATNMVYALDIDFGQLYVLDEKRNYMISNFSVPGKPDNLIVNKNTNTVYITDRDASRIYAVSGETNNGVNSTIIVSSPTNLPFFYNVDLSVNPKSNMIYVSRDGMSIISTINGSSNKLIKTVRIGQPLSDIDIDPDNGIMYISNEKSDTISTINVNNYPIFNPTSSPDGTNLGKSVLEGIRVGNRPSTIAVNSETHRIYVAYDSSERISIIDSKTYGLLDNIDVGNFVDDIEVVPSTNKIYVLHFNYGAISVIDGETNEITNTIEINGRDPLILDTNDLTEDFRDIAVNPYISRVYVTSSHSDFVQVIDSYTDNVIEEIPIKPGVADWAIDTNYINTWYATYPYDNAVNYGYSGEEEIILPTFPTLLDFNPFTRILYVINGEDEFNSPRFLTSFDTEGEHVLTNRSLQSLPVSAMAINPLNETVYVAYDFRSKQEPDFITLINGITNTIISNITGVSGPTDIDVDTRSNIVYITNRDTSIISVINGSSGKPISKIAISVNPSNSGTIYCNEKRISDNFINYDIDVSLDCEAQPNNEYIFDSWSTDLGFDLSSNPSIEFTPEKVKQLTANFREAPPPLIPSDYLFTVLIPVILGIIAAPLGGWFYSRRHKRNLYRYMKLIDTIYRSYDPNQRNSQSVIEKLDSWQIELKNLFEKGKISDSHFNMLDNKISDYVKELKLASSRDSILPS